MTPPKKAASSAVTAKVEAVAKKAVAKRVAPALRPAPKVEPEVKLTATVGTTVEIEVDQDATSVLVERPDGSEATVSAAGGRALYVLDQAGPHIMGGLRVAAVEAVLEA